MIVRSAAGISQLIVAGLIGLSTAVVLLVLINRVHWPAYPSSNQLHALTTVAQTATLAALVLCGWFWRRCPKLSWLGSLIAIATLASVTLAMPLGATRLYLFGISVDQQFRTEYITRFTDQASLADMTYRHLPPFYPPGWFWVGGRLAAGLHLSGWQMYKPWAIMSISAAATITLLLWIWLLKPLWALCVGVVSVLITIAVSAAEPYAAILLMMTAPILIISWQALVSPQWAHRWITTGAVGIFLGLSATIYTLVTVYLIGVIGLMGVGAMISRYRQERDLGAISLPCARMILMGVLCACGGALTWLPYLRAMHQMHIHSTGGARHYLPAEGAQLSFPMFQQNIIGIVCLIGVIWLITHLSRSSLAIPLGIGVIGIYLWDLSSMIATVMHTTLLGFRLHPLLVILLGVCGVFGILQASQALHTISHYGAYALGVCALLAVLAYAQQIPALLRPDLIVAYSDTDGHGQRADRRAPGAEKYYPAIDEKITATTGLARNQIVVLTADYSFLSYYPYWGFQTLTSHYANPLAQFPQRAQVIGSWVNLHDSSQFLHALDTLPWQAPSVFVLRHGSPGHYSLRLAQDVYPNQPNVRRYTVELDTALFRSSEFDVSTIGPFVVAIRTHHHA